MTPEEGKAELDRLRSERQEARERLERLDSDRRALLRDLLGEGVTQAELARWEGVTPWAIGQAVRRAVDPPSVATPIARMNS